MLNDIAEKIIFYLEKLGPLSIFALRVWVAHIFFASALLKLPNGFLGLGMGDWGTTVLLFMEEHPVPLLPAEVAAVLGTTVEFLAPIALVLGLGARIGAVGLLVMTAVIEFTYQHSMEHIIWAISLSVILFQGPGLISIDHFIRKRLLNDC